MDKGLLKPLSLPFFRTLNVTGKSQLHVQKPRIVPAGLSSSQSPSGLVLAGGRPRQPDTPHVAQACLGRWQAQRGHSSRTCLSREGKPRGSSFLSASPALAFASQTVPLLETPGELSRKEPSSSPGNGSPACAQGPCERAAALLQGPGAQSPAVIFNCVSHEPGVPREPLPSPGCTSPLQANCSRERSGGQTDRQTEPN